MTVYTISNTIFRPGRRMKEGKSVLISRKVTEEGAEIGYICREEDDGKDSGWRLYSGDEGPLFFMEPDHMVAADLNDVMRDHPELVPLLSSPAGSEYRRDGEGRFTAHNGSEEKAEELLMSAFAGPPERKGSALRLLALLAAAALLYLVIRSFW